MVRVQSKRRAMLWALMICAAVSGCATMVMPRLEPPGQPGTGTHNEPYPAREVPGGQLPWDNTELLLAPRVTVAPIGSEVVMLAGVRGPDQYLRMNEQVEWTLEPGGVGQFIDVDRKTACDVLVGDFTDPRKISPGYAVTSTSRQFLRLTRGTANTQDDVYVLRGQTWASITSPTEGTSYVTAFAPSVYGWDRRTQTGLVHWIDAQWQFPPPAINAAGTRHVFTTSVVRLSDQSPRMGWLVRYSIAGGPAAGFAPSGASSIEVPTDATGRATAEIFQQRATPGTNLVNVQIIRPAGPAGTTGPLVVGNGSTTKTWSAPGLALRVAGPAVGSVGATLSYRLEVSNPGDLPLEAIAISDDVPDGLSYIRSDPPAQASGRSLRWSIPRLAAHECCTVRLDLRADRAGIVSHCAEATTGSGLRAKECATTSVSVTPVGPPFGTGTPITPSGPPTSPPTSPPGSPTPALELKYTGPDQATVGQLVTLAIAVTNRGTTTASGLSLRVRFDPGLEHPMDPAQIKRPLGTDLAPGQTTSIGVEFRVTRLGRLCSTVEVGGVTAEKCLTAVEASLAKPLPTKPPRSLNNVSVKVSTPNLAPPAVIAEGELAEFEIVVANVGKDTVTNVVVKCGLDSSLSPSQATRGHQMDPTDNSVNWTVSTLPPGAKETFGLACKGARATLRACCRVTATAQEGDRAQGEACLDIRQPTPQSTEGLSMTIDSPTSSVSAGRQFSYLVRVSNRGSTPHKNVALTVTFPQQLLPAPLGTLGPTNSSIKGQKVQFDALPQLFPGVTEEYRIRALARQPGDVVVQAQVNSSVLTRPILAEAKTKIIQER